MSTYQDAVDSFSDEPVPPPKVIQLPLSAWASGYSAKPECEVSFGIRLPGQDDVEAIEAEAMRAARSAQSATGDVDALRAYNEEKLVSLVARCICSSTDVTQPHELFETPDALLRIALTPQGLRRLFDEIERLQIESSPIFVEATDSEVVELFERIQDGELARCQDVAISGRIRRYLAFCLESLSENVQST